MWSSKSLDKNSNDIEPAQQRTPATVTNHWMPSLPPAIAHTCPTVISLHYPFCLPAPPDMDAKSQAQAPTGCDLGA